MGDFAALRAHGLAFPEVVEDFPWGHTALKVRNKTFAWLDESEGALSLTVKLPVSRDFAETFDFAAPAGYGRPFGLDQLPFRRRRDGRSRPPQALDRGELPRGGTEETGGARPRRRLSGIAIFGLFAYAGANPFGIRILYVDPSRILS